MATSNYLHINVINTFFCLLVPNWHYYLVNTTVYLVDFSLNVAFPIDHGKFVSNGLHFLIVFVDPPHTIMKNHNIKAKIKWMIIAFHVKGI